jgi:hypothetical protein
VKQEAYNLRTIIFTFYNICFASITFRIPNDLKDSTPEILTFLETASENKLILEWGLSHATLEEVLE